jgi:hypothetical protein
MRNDQQACPTDHKPDVSPECRERNSTTSEKPNEFCFSLHDQIGEQDILHRRSNITLW